MPPNLESDSVDDITIGTYVYYMKTNEAIARGDLGEVYGEDDDQFKVLFPEGKAKISKNKCNVADVQKGSFVHMASEDYSKDAIGEVKALEDGKLQVEVEGKEVIVHPKSVFRCDFQPGMFVFWTRADDDIPSGHMGEVLPDLNDEGRVKVKFPNGAWRFKPYQMVRSPFQMNSLVRWTSSDDDIAKGEVGQVVGGPNEESRIQVQFAKGKWRFRPKELFQIEMQLHSFVTWQKHDEDVPKGSVGEVTKVKVEQGRLKVRFPKGSWTFKTNELQLYHLQPGQFVHWQKCDEDIVRGDIGEIVRRSDMKETRFYVQWPQGAWSMKPAELQKCAFQRDDRVQWNGADDDIPEGHIGQVMHIKYGGDKSGQNLYVRFPNGFWSFKPHSLKSINLDSDAINELKATFKRFDKNGDGKLSPEEMKEVLGNLGGGLSDDECGQLFEALDKDGDGKLTSNEFIDYVFGTEASGSQKKLLGDGFGLSGLAGIDDEEDEDEDDDDDDPNSGGGGGNQSHDQQTFDVTFDAEDKEGIDGETMVSKAEWASAMLTVGVCRAASIEAFEGALADLEQEGEEIAVKYLAMELNGMGVAGIEELRGPIGRVKHGKVPPLDLEKPPEESEFEVDLAKKTGIDGMLRHLQVKGKGADDAVGELEHAMLSSLEAKVLGDMGDDLVDAVKEAEKTPNTLSAVSSYHRARENCRREVQEIIDRCKSSGEKFVDTTWDPNSDENFVLYVDKEAPGWDCTARKPYSGWRRITEIWNNGSPSLVVGDASHNDVDQGSCGDCFLLGALGSVAANRKRFVRQAVVHYDQDVGVYGVLFCVEGNFTYEIIDDFMGCRSKHSVMWAKSMQFDETWVSVLEKAYFKHHKCVEMCDGGHGTESMFCFVGGVTGQYDVGSKYFDKPNEYFELVTKALAAGEMMCTGWYAPSKGKFANLEGGEGGPCGETGLPYGLIGGHCYSVIRTAEVDGTKLICVRNPWGKGEWKGAYSDKSEEMTDELKAALNYECKVDGTFWMNLEDFVQCSKRCTFLKQFGPTWQCAVTRGRFSNDVEKGRAKKDYQAADDDEISFKKGDLIQVTEIQGYWAKGIHLKTEEAGYYRSKDVELQIKSVMKFTLDVEGVNDGEPLIWAMMVENQMMRREWKKRKVDGMNYKDKKQPSGMIFFRDKNGKGYKGKKLRYRHYWDHLDPALAPYRIYVAVCSGKGMRYNSYGYVRHGKVKLEQQAISYSDFLDEYNS